MENKKEIRSINSNDKLYNNFQLEQLEERLEMGGWLCGADCGVNCVANCDVNCTVDDICGVDANGSWCKVDSRYHPI